MAETKTYLSISDQERVIRDLYGLRQQLPMREQFWVSNGDKAAGLAVMASGLVFWRAGFRGFGLSKFNRARFSTCLFTIVNSFHGTMIHAIFVRSSLQDYYRKENALHYGIKSLISHQAGLLLTFIAAAGSTFGMAQYSGMIPVPKRFLSRNNRLKVLKYCITQFGPFRNTIAMTVMVSSLFATLVGVLEFRQSQKLLARLDRKSLVYREGS